MQTGYAIMSEDVDMFYAGEDPSHKHKVMLTMLSSEAFPFAYIEDALRTKNKLNEIGGHYYLVSLDLETRKVIMV